MNNNLEEQLVNISKAHAFDIVKKQADGLNKKLTALCSHILAMADDSYLCGHPEWIEIVNEAKKAMYPC